MKLTKLSRDRMMLSASRWTVPRDYFEPLYNYLVHGYDPGSFWAAVLANDFFRAMQHSHPSNSIPHLKLVVGWIRDSFPAAAYGDHEMVHEWMALDAIDRRIHLEDHRLIYTEQEEIILGLKGTKSEEPFLY